MDLNRYTKPPELSCPACRRSLDDPRWRIKCFTSPFGTPCPCQRQVQLRMGSNYWYALIIAACVLLIGGRLWSAGLPFLLAWLFFGAGVVVMLWGFYHSGLVILRRPDKDAEKDRTTQTPER